LAEVCHHGPSDLSRVQAELRPNKQISLGHTLIIQNQKAPFNIKFLYKSQSNNSKSKSSIFLDANKKTEELELLLASK